MQSIEQHELEMHKHDEEILTTLFGPKRSAAKGGGRELEKGLAHQLKHDKFHVKLAKSDKFLLALILAIAEALRIMVGAL